MKHFTVLLVSLCLVMLEAVAASPDLPVRFAHYHAQFVLDAEARVVERHEWAKTVLKEGALDSAKQASISYSNSAQKAEVLLAYTQKADGRRVDVPKDNYQLAVNSGKGADSPVYSDWATITVVFPDVAVGDTVVFAYQLTQSEAMYPGHFSTAQQFHRNIAYDDVRVRFDLPESLWVQYHSRDMQEEVNVRDGRRMIEWRFANPQPVRIERRNYSVHDSDKEVGYAISTFRNHADIARAYGVRALPKAAVSERIRHLAGEIVGGKTDKREQARAIYEWVATQITYAGNCIGIGAVVPHDIDFILDNKMGDCKDHATLLQALLEARGIRSTQALINAGSGYRLQKIPVSAQVNHVLNYLPDFDLFVDSTSDSTPFGMLPFAAQDKPALLVENYREGLKTPIEPLGRSRQSMRNTIKIAADGSVSGNIEVEQLGSPAVHTREWARKLSRDFEEDLVRDFFRARGIIGSGSLRKDDPAALNDRYRYQASFQAEKFIKPQGAGSFYVLPPLSIAPLIFSAAQSAMEPELEADVSCTAGKLVEDYVIEVPKNKKILAVPENLKLANQWLSYTASYRLKGNTLTVHRELDDRTRGNVCSSKMMLEYKEVAEKVIDNLKEQVLYR